MLISPSKMRIFSEISSTPAKETAKSSLKQPTFETVDPVSIRRVREKFFNNAYAEEREAFDPEDIEQVKVNDWYIKRYLLATNHNEKEAYERLVTSLRWRKEMGIRHCKDSDFMQELYNTGSLFAYEKDKDGLPSLVMRLKFLKRVPEYIDNMKLFCMYNIFKVDECVNGTGWTLILDFAGCGVQHASNLDVCHYFVSSMTSYFPNGMHKVLCVDLPWMLTSFWSVIKLWIPEKRRHMVQFMKKSALLEYFEKENLPPVLGGTCKRDYKAVPEGAPSSFEYGLSIGLDEKRCEAIYQDFLPLFDKCFEEEES